MAGSGQLREPISSSSYLPERILERGAGGDVLLEGAAEEGPVSAADGDEVVRRGGAGDLDQHPGVLVVHHPPVAERLVRQPRVPLRRVYGPQHHRVPEVPGELGAEAVEEGLPVEPRVRAAYLRALRGRPPAQDVDQRLLVRAPAYLGRSRNRVAKLRGDDTMRAAWRRVGVTLHSLPEALGVGVGGRGRVGARDDGDGRHVSSCYRGRRAMRRKETCK